MRVERPVAKGLLTTCSMRQVQGDLFLSLEVPSSPIVLCPNVPVCIWRSHSERLRLLPIQGLRATLAWLTAAVICFNQNPSHFISRLESSGLQSAR